MAGLVTAASRVGRRPRKPAHTFSVAHIPFVLQPFMIAPVLPGETMKNLLLQDRVVSQPVKHPLLGWWLEYYVFYVKLRDLAGRDEFTTMLIDPNNTPSGLPGVNTGIAPHYAATQSEAVDYVGLCMERVYDEYFINQDTDATYSGGAPKIGDLPVVSVNRSDLSDSLILDADYYRPDEDVDADADGTITASEVDKALRNYQWLRANGLTDVSYEDYLRTFGISVPSEEQHVPELVRYIREWAYPTNTVEPTTGTPTSALSWSIQERADKDRFFREPGFLFGVTCARPKIYFGGQNGAAVSWLNDALSWLPAVMRDDPITSMKKFAGVTAGPAGPYGVDDPYWLDMRDLFLYGDQFIAGQTGSFMEYAVFDLPDNTGLRRYPTSGNINGLFVDGTKNKIRHDGIVTLTIMGAEMDYSATTQGNLRNTLEAI